jgi:hypothetical protein
MPLKPMAAGRIGRGGPAGPSRATIAHGRKETPEPMSMPRSPHRRTAGVRLLLVAVVVSTLFIVACAPDSKTAKTVDRPTTPAKLQILSPEPNAVTGPSVDLKLQLENASVVTPGTVSGVNPDEGHIHVSVDGKLVSMTFGLTQQITVKPGTHTVQAQFVASDHRPFANSVVAAVSFESK